MRCAAGWNKNTTLLGHQKSHSVLSQSLSLTTAEENNENRIAVARAGAIQPLCQLLANGTEEGKQEAAQVLAYLARNDDNKITIARGGAIVPLVALLTNESEGVKTNACRALANLGEWTGWVEFLLLAMLVLISMQECRRHRHCVLAT